MGFRRFAFALAIMAAICSARHFEVSEEGADQPCVLLDVSFNIEVTAMKDGNVVAVENLTPDDKNVYALGECINSTNEIAIFFKKKSMWAIAFQPYDTHPVAMYRVFQFIPKEIFGSAVNITDQIGFSDPRPVYLKDVSHSYKCGIKDEWAYSSYTPVSSYNFTATVTVFDIQTQGMGLTGREYGPAEVCISPVPVPSPKPVTGKPASPPKPVTHVVKSTTPVHPVTHISPTQQPVPPAKAPLNSYSVKNGDEVCISMETMLTLVIKYPVTTADKYYKTATVNVPGDAKATGNCQVSETTQELSITFLNGWELKFTFTKDTDSLIQGALTRFSRNNPEPSYRISNITLLVVVDKKIFPDSVLGEGAKYTEVPASKTPDFPKKLSKDSDYFRCDSNDVNQLNEGVEVKTAHLKFKAFNTDAKPSFDGRATVCGGDHHTASKAGLIAGIIITIVVVGAVSALIVVMISRRRKLRYENIQ